MVLIHSYLLISFVLQSREHFCQLVQLIRNRMRSDQDQDSISVFVGTWNMGEETAAPPHSRHELSVQYTIRPKIIFGFQAMCLFSFWLVFR